MTGTRIHLIRHGEVHNPHDILYGRLSRFRLTARGRRQAQAAGALLKDRGLQALYTSPLLRARQTAAEISRIHGGLRPGISALINEALTPFEGLPAAQAHSRRGDFYSHDQAGRFEQPADILARAQRFLQRCLLRHAGGEIAAVTHGDVVVFTVLWALGAELTPRNKNRLRKSGYAAGYPGHCSITSLNFENGLQNDRPRLEYYAVTE
jgi:broad specificity phosphatase PhoE